MNDTLERAIALACRVHAGQRDKAGKAYILHPLRLMLRFDDAESQMVAVLHDVVEDAGITLDDLRALGIPEPVLAAIDCLSKREGEGYEAFIERIRPNPLARRVKLADIRDNLDVSRLPHLDDKDLARVAKYHRALQVLEAQG